MKLFGDATSGNCLKVKYTADHLGLAHEWIPVDIAAGETRSPEFLRLNPQGQVPVWQLADGRCLAQSNAIVRYLAADSPLLPADRFLQAKVDELLFWEQYSHEPYVAVCRSQMLHEGRTRDARDGWRVERGERALDYLEDALESRTWLVGQALTIADVCLLAYTRLAPEGGFDLSARPALRGWIGRCEQALGLE